MKFDLAKKKQIHELDRFFGTKNRRLILPKLGSNKQMSVCIRTLLKLDIRWSPDVVS